MDTVKVNKTSSISHQHLKTVPRYTKDHSTPTVGVNTRSRAKSNVWVSALPTSSLSKSFSDKTCTCFAQTYLSYSHLADIDVDLSQLIIVKPSLSTEVESPKKLWISDQTFLGEIDSFKNNNFSVKN